MPLQSTTSTITIPKSPIIPHQAGMPTTPKQQVTRPVVGHSRVPCIFATLGIAVTMAVVGGVVAFEYSRLSNAVEVMVEQQAETVLNGAVGYIADYNRRTVTTTRNLQQEIRSSGNASTEPIKQIANLTLVLNRTMLDRTIADSSDMGYCVTVVGPPVSANSYPLQDLSTQNQCIGLCLRAGDPSFTTIAEYGVIRDNIIGVVNDEFRLLSAYDSANTSFTSMFLVNRTNPSAPSWVGSNEEYQRRLQRGTVYRVGSSLSAYTNGSAFDGIWNPMAVTTSPSGQSYYFFKYRQAFVHPLSNLVVIITNYVSANQYQRVLVKYAEQVGGNDGHLILVDGKARVLGYNHDPYGDNRLANCTTSVAPGTPNRGCEDFYAVSHPSVFVQVLFGEHQAFIMSHSSNTRQKWFNFNSTRYLLVVRPIIDEGATRIIASFSLREQDVLGSLKRNIVIIVAFAGAATAAACLVLTAAGFASLYGANQTVVLVAKLAKCIGRYDVDAADRAIAKAQARRTCFKAVTPMERQFSVIVGNLRAYRPFLPAAMLVLQDSTSSFELPSSSASITAIPYTNKIARTSTSFGFFSGSLVLVDLGNLPVGTTMMYRDQREVGELIKDFLKQCMEVVERFGGVVELLRANQLMVSFNCHTTVRGHEDVACRCALELSKAMCGGAAWCGHRMNVAVSVASGSGLVGSGGSSTVRTRMLAGEPVDLLRRLPALQRMLGVPVLATGAATHGLSGSVVRVPVDVIEPTWYQESRTSAVVVYELLSGDLDVDDAAAAAARTTTFSLLHTQGDHAGASSILAGLAPPYLGQFAFMRLRQLVAARTGHSLHRREVPWEALEGRGFLDRSVYRIRDQLMHGGSTCQATAISSPSTSKDAPVEAGLDRSTAITIHVPPSNASQYGDRLVSLMSSSSNSHGGISSTPKKRKGSPAPSWNAMHGSLTVSISRMSLTTPASLRRVVAESGDAYYLTGMPIRKGAAGVELAFHETGGLVAVRQISLQSLPDGVQPLIREMEQLSSLSHPNVASYVACAVNRQDSVFCIMTEFLPAGSLLDLITISAPFIPPAMAVRYATDLCKGIDYLHNRKPPILHTDVRPHNVLMTTEGSCRLANFAKSRALLSTQPCKVCRDTPRYMAPETAMGEFTPASDMYSVGITMLHMLLGRLPWDHVNGDDANFPAHHTAMSASLPPKVLDWLDDDLRDLIERCTAHDPAARPTVRDALHVLLTWSNANSRSRNKSSITPVADTSSSASVGASASGGGGQLPSSSKSF